jgi:hypothetical protein
MVRRRVFAAIRSCVARAFAVIMSAVVMVHEEMHQRARDEKQQWPPAKEVHPMLFNQVETTDSQKANQHNVCARSKKTTRLAILIPVFHLDLRNRRTLFGLPNMVTT